jgi:hypothetical protein
VLDDLATWTDLNTIELSNFFLDWGEADSWDTPNPPAPLALPATARFSDLPVPVLDDGAFDSVLGAIDVVKTSGFSAACNVAPLYLADPGLSRLACVDITGKRARGLRSSLAVYGCPSDSEVVAYGEAMMREFATCWPTADAITLNHVEYPFWPQAAVSELFACFCDSCRAKAESAGLDFERVRAEVASAYELFTTRRGRARARAIDVLTLLIERPDLGAWLSFRLGSMADYVRRVVEAGREAAARHNPELKIGLEFQAPAVSLLVGTDFRTLAPLFDWLTPKFPDYLAAAVIPIVADELATAGAAELRAALRELLLLGPGPAEYEPAADLSEGIRYRNAFDLEMIDLQVPLLGDLPSTKTTYPYLWLYEGDTRSLSQKIEAVARHGFEGYFLWAWDDDLATDALKLHRASR